ncbi:ORF57-like protein [Bufonid herpesvirus 1]|uniref:ORF57-like protein n=1 Tax=Bufonid herpesvirus 1 TaxID=2282206 RepID=UPI000EB67DDE|nr:ORF57-like protein [Bufonid herpesvirus 1]AXF48584.1 ORF57-like protein [Bufonid herpesvirus 1]
MDGKIVLANFTNVTSVYTVLCCSYRNFPNLIVKKLNTTNRKYSFSKTSKKAQKQWCMQDPLSLYVGNHTVFLKTLPGHFLNWWFGKQVVDNNCLIDSFADKTVFETIQRNEVGALKKALKNRQGIASAICRQRPGLFRLTAFFNPSLNERQDKILYFTDCVDQKQLCVPKEIAQDVECTVIDAVLCSPLIRLISKELLHAVEIPTRLIDITREFLNAYKLTMTTAFAKRHQVLQFFYISRYQQIKQIVDSKYDVYKQRQQDTFLESYVAVHFIALCAVKSINILI